MAMLPQLNESDVKKAAETKLLTPDVWMAFVVAGGKASVNEKSGHYELMFIYAPLADPADPDKRGNPVMYDRISLPVTNEDFTTSEGEAHEAPDTYNIVASRLYAFFGEWSEDNKDGMPALPKKQGGTYVYKGEAIDQSAYDECKAEVTKAVLGKAISLYGELVEGELSIKGSHVFFAKVKHSDPAKTGGRTFQNVADIAAELPKNAEALTDPKQFKYKP